MSRLTSSGGGPSVELTMRAPEPPRGVALDIAMKTAFYLSVAASAVALCSTGAFAQSVDLPEDEEVNSETIVVTANRT